VPSSSSTAPIAKMSAALARIRTLACTSGTPSSRCDRPEMMAIDTPASTANRMLERPFTTSSHVPGSPQSNGCCTPTCAPNIPSTARPRAMSTPTIRSPPP
jgi:hypothetical protein